MKNLPPQTGEIFDYLSKGNFVSDNSNKAIEQEYYKILEQAYQPLYAFFKHIHFTLEQGNGYFYFSRKDSKNTLEQKIVRAFKWIDIVDFFKSFRYDFGAGVQFRPAEISEQCKVNSDLRQKLKELKRYTDTNKELEAVQKLVKLLQNQGFVVLLNEIEDSYKVLSAFDYLERLITSINIQESEITE